MGSRSSDHTVNLILRAKGREEIKALQESIGYTKKSLEQLASAYDAGGIKATAYDAAKARLTRQLEREEKALERITAQMAKVRTETDAAAATMSSFGGQVRQVGTANADLERTLKRSTGSINTATAATEKLGGSGKGSSIGRTTQFISQMGYAIDDAQYGMKGLQNNIMSVLVPFGLWGTIIGTSITGVYQLYTHWNTLTSSFRPGLIDQAGAATKRLSERITELKGQSKLTAEDLRELAEAEKKVGASKFADESRGKATTAQGDVKKGFADALAVEGGGYGQLRNVVAMAVRADLEQFMNHGDTHKDIQRAIKAGQMKNDDGSAISAFDQRKWEDSQKYRDRLTKSYRNYRTEGNEAEVDSRLQKIGEKGDIEEFRKLESSAKQQGYNVAPDGTTTDQKGKAMPGLTELFKQDPKRIAKKSIDDEFKASQVKAEDEHADEIKSLAEQFKAVLANALSEGRDPVKAAADAMKAAFPGVGFENGTAEGVAGHAKRSLSAEVDALAVAQGLPRPRALKEVQKKYREQANAVKLEDEEKDKAKRDGNTAQDLAARQAQRDALTGGSGSAKEQAEGIIRQFRNTPQPNARARAQGLAAARAEISRIVRDDLRQRGGFAENEIAEHSAAAPDFFAREMAGGDALTAERGVDTVNNRSRIPTRGNRRLTPDEMARRNRGNLDANGRGRAPAVATDAPMARRRVPQPGTGPAQGPDTAADVAAARAAGTMPGPQGKTMDLVAMQATLNQKIALNQQQMEARLAATEAKNNAAMRLLEQVGNNAIRRGR